MRSGTEVHAVSARPSDAVALAVRFGAPVFAEEGVLDEAARPAEEGLPDDVVEQFRSLHPGRQPRGLRLLAKQPWRIGTRRGR